MATHQYVCADVTSDGSADSMTYYTRHSKMAASGYVCDNVSSDYPTD
jgi:hypothetical protein